MNFTHPPMYFTQIVSGLLIALHASECYTHKYYAIFSENYNREKVWIQRKSNINSYLFSSTKKSSLKYFYSVAG